MALPSYLVDYFNALDAEERSALKRAFEGDFPETWNYGILMNKLLDNDEELLDKVLPKFAVSLKEPETEDFLLRIRRQELEVRRDHWYKNLEETPIRSGVEIELCERALSVLSISSLRGESDSYYYSVVASMHHTKRVSLNQAREDYCYVFCLKIFYEKFKSDAAMAEKYQVAGKEENKLYKYYKALDVDLEIVDRQFAKYDLLSISSSEQIMAGLPSRIFDADTQSQFLVDVPEVILEMFAALLDSGAIKAISFLVECNVVFQTSARIFMLMEGNPPKYPVLFSGLVKDVRDQGVTREVVKDTIDMKDPSRQVRAGRFYDANKDSAWYFIGARNIYFEEIPNNPEALDDCVVTKLIHAEYFVRGGKIFLSHIDHEYIFYSYEEFDRRLGDFSQKGSARKRIKTFKIDYSEIPLVLEGGVSVLSTLFEYLFAKPYLFNGFIREITTAPWAPVGA